MSEEQKTPDTAPKQGDTQGESDFLEGTYKGQKVTWTKDKAAELAQKGLDYETKMAKLKAEKEALSSDREDFERWKQWRDTMRGDPRRAEAVARAYQDPDIVLSDPVGDHEDGEDQPKPKRRSAPQSTPPEVLTLKQQVDQLQAQLREVQSGESARATERRLGRAADSFGFLSDNQDAKGLAIEMAEGLMARDSEMSPEGAMAVAAERVKALVRGQDQKKLDKKGKGADMKTVPADQGTPSPAVGDRKKKHDPRRRRVSSLRGDVINELANGVFKERFPNL